MPDDNKRKGESGAELHTEPHPADDPKKKSFHQKLAEFLMSRDYKATFKDVYRNILTPEIKKTAFNAIVAVVRDFIFSRGQGPSDSSFASDYRNYGSFFGDSSGRESESKYRKERKDIAFRSRQEAEELLGRMRSLLKKKGLVTVADYYNMAGKDPYYTYYDLGWINLDSVTIFSFLSGGATAYALKLPEPMPINREPN